MDKTPGQIAFEAFFSLKLDGRWKVQPDVIKEAWEASAKAVVTHHQKEIRGGL